MTKPVQQRLPRLITPIHSRPQPAPESAYLIGRAVCRSSASVATCALLRSATARLPTVASEMGGVVGDQRSYRSSLLPTDWHQHVRESTQLGTSVVSGAQFRATSRKETGPAPVNVFTIAIRFGARTFQSRSNDSKEILWSCCLPEKAAFTRCRKDSVVSTVIVTAAISLLPPSGDISQKVVQ